MASANDTPADELRLARARLDECERLVDKLHTLCCEPDRSPRMRAILSDIGTARDRIDTFDVEASPREIIEILEGIGAQVGHLQVACCTSARMPLYAETLSGLAATQIHISRSAGQGH
jgi:hypothetical protein